MVSAKPKLNAATMKNPQVAFDKLETDSAASLFAGNAIDHTGNHARGNLVRL